MDFKESKAIYLQIAERLSHEILLDKYHEEERIPSVREYAVEMEVNVNTMMRSYEYLQQENIIFNKRGIGYFVSVGAKELIYKAQKEHFVKDQLYEFFNQIELLDISIDKIVELYQAYRNTKSKELES